MLERGILRRYAKALFELARDAEQEEAVLEDLRWLESLLESEADIGRYVCDPRVPVAEKRKFARKMLPESMNELARNFALLIVDRGRSQVLPMAADEFEALLLEARGTSAVEVTSAKALDEETLASLGKQMEQATGGPVRLTAAVDESILGGLRIKVGSTLYDGSLRRRLETMRQDLMKVSLPELAPISLGEDEV